MKSFLLTWGFLFMDTSGYYAWWWSRVISPLAKISGLPITFSLWSNGRVTVKPVTTASRKSVHSRDRTAQHCSPGIPFLKVIWTSTTTKNAVASFVSGLQEVYMFTLLLYDACWSIGQSTCRSVCRSMAIVVDMGGSFGVLVCVCMCACIYVCVCACVYVHVCACMCMWVSFFK